MDPSITPPVGGPAAPPGAGPGAAPPPMMPKSPAGGPGGPGASPMLSPGGGAGNQAAAMQSVKVAMPTLLHAALAFTVGSKEQQALINAYRALTPIFGKAEGANMVPAGIASMAMNAGKGGGMSAAPPPGIKPTNTPPPGMDIPGGAMEEAA